MLGTRCPFQAEGDAGVDLVLVTTVREARASGVEGSTVPDVDSGVWGRVVVGVSTTVGGAVVFAAWSS